MGLALTLIVAYPNKGDGPQSQREAIRPLLGWSRRVCLRKVRFTVKSQWDDLKD